MNQIQKAKHLLPYLGDQKYVEICQLINKGRTAIINLCNQTNPIIHDLFVQIIRIIKYFSEKYVLGNHPNADIMKSVSMFLDKMEREEYLFKCLSVPNDDVRL